MIKLNVRRINCSSERDGPCRTRIVVDGSFIVNETRQKSAVKVEWRHVEFVKSVYCLHPHKHSFRRVQLFFNAVEL